MTDGESCPSVAGARLGSQKARGIHWHVNEVLPASATAGRTTPAVRVVRHRYHASRASLRPAFSGMPTGPGATRGEALGRVVGP